MGGERQGLAFARGKKETPTRLEHVAQSLAAHFSTDEPGLVENILHLRRDEQASVELWACQVIRLARGGHPDAVQ